MLCGTLFFTGAASATCAEDSLETVSDDGDILIMQSGHVYQVDSGDTVDTRLWLSAEDVLICKWRENLSHEGMVCRSLEFKKPNTASIAD